MGGLRFAIGASANLGIAPPKFCAAVRAVASPHRTAAAFLRHLRSLGGKVVDDHSRILQFNACLHIRTIQYRASKVGALLGKCVHTSSAKRTDQPHDYLTISFLSMNGAII
jgi:hypothetical protein